MTDQATIFLLAILAAQCCFSAAGQCALEPARVDAILKPLYMQVEALKEQLNVSNKLAMCSCVGAELPEEVAVCTDEGPLGMEDGRIPDSSITASSKWQNNDNYGPQRARLNTKGYVGSWIGNGNDQEPWIQVDFQKNVHITGVITQGRNDRSQWVREYQVAFSQDGSTWTKVADAEGAPITFAANTDSNTEVTNRFTAALTARYLRIYLTAWEAHRSMRFEVIGCASESDKPFV